MYDDVDFIQDLRKKGYKTGIVTGAPIHIASLEINMLGKHNFDAIVIADNVNWIKPKPHPHGLHECLTLLKSKEEEAVYIGNAD